MNSNQFSNQNNKIYISTISNLIILRKCEHNSTSLCVSLKLSGIIIKRYFIIYTDIHENMKTTKRRGQKSKLYYSFTISTISHLTNFRKD